MERPTAEKTDGQRQAVPVVAGRKTSGEAVYEEVLVDNLGNGRFRLVASPAIVLGAAAGDEIMVDSDGTMTVVSRGGNLAIQVYGPHDLADEIVREVNDLGGRMDGRAPGLTVFTLPVRVGFAKIEAMFNQLALRHPSIEWYFGNVYDTDGVTPLGWWESA